MSAHVAETQVTDFQYDQEKRSLLVRLKDGVAHIYHGVPFELADRFARAESAGRFIEQHLGVFPHRRVA